MGPVPIVTAAAPMAESVIGWDVGGAHLKAAWLDGGRVRDSAQWPCPLWHGLGELERALEAAGRRFPGLQRHAHAVTMTGEMVDCFASRAEGVARIAGLLAMALPGLRFYAGDAGWCKADEAPARWREIASANWRATASHVAQALAGREGLLVDIGSTTADLVAFRAGRVASASRGDADRLASGELVYQGVVRTPLCALGPTVPWRGKQVNVMNEFFATTADVYRLTGELDDAHDQHPAADGGAKHAAGTQARLARMIGLDAGDADAAEWRAFAQAWRARQVALLRDEAARVARAQRLGDGAVVVGAGCGAFLVPEIAPAGWPRLDYARDIAGVADPALAAWTRVGAPAVAVAALLSRERA